MHHPVHPSFNPLSLLFSFSLILRNGCRPGAEPFSCNPPSVRRGSPALILFLLCLAVLLTACSRETGEKKTPPVPVVTGVAVQKLVPLQIENIGSALPYSAISVRSKVSGEITQVHFREGEDVRKGDLLFRIDCRDLAATLRQAEATMARDAAISRNAEEDATRYKYLSEKGYVARQQYDQVRTNAESTRAVVEADRALVENIKVRLGYCAIFSPISGRTGDLMVDRGNLVKENDTVLVTVNQIRPIYVGFTVPEKYLADIKRRAAARDLKVHARIPNDPEPEEGVLTFIDNTVDHATGTIALKATFPNGQRRLWPGQFLNVTLTLGRETAVLVPSRAVLTGQNGTYLFIVKTDHTVETRPVEVKRVFGEESVIGKGVQPGERIVLDGQLRLTQGTKVSLKAEPSQGAKEPKGR